MEQLPENTREFYATLERRLSTFTPLIQIVCGPRQVGKTTALRQFQSRYRDKTIFLNFDNPGPTPQERLRFEFDNLSRRSGHKILILDELQNVPNWAPLIKELYDRERPKRELSLAILGSSALDILLRGEESLLGRFEIIRAPHWNFKETKQAFGWSLERYLQFGGYPVLSEIVAQEDTNEGLIRCQNFVRDAILEPVLTRDIFSLQAVANTALFRQVLQIALSLPCQEISFAKLLGQLSEKGSSATVKNYLELLEKAFLLRLVYRFSEGRIRSRTTSPKIVPLAPALIHSFTDPLKIHSDSTWFGQVFEAAVISRFAELGYELFYWSNSRQDVDLVVRDSQSLYAIEVKAGADNDWLGLNAFHRNYPHARLLLLNRTRGEEFLAHPNPREYIQSIAIDSSSGKM